MRLRIRRWRYWTLRSRLVLTICVLTIVALVAANAAGLLLLRNYLTQRIDQQILGQGRPFAVGLRNNPTPAGVSRPPFRSGPDQFLFLRDPSGNFDAGRSTTPTDAQPTVTNDLATPTAKPRTVLGADGTTDWRIMAVPVSGTGSVVILGVSLTEVQQTGERLLLIDLAVMGTVLSLLGVLAAVTVRLGMRPLTRMENVVEQITAGDLSPRVDDTDRHTEPGRLGAATNLMLDRIETEMSARDASERRLRQFVADASHELRTPLTSIRGFAELYRRGGAPEGPILDETMSRIEAEAARMGVLVEDLLLLARLDRQRTPVLRPVDLLEIAADTIRDAHARVPGRPVRLTGLDDLEPPVVLGDEHGLRQVAANLVANALQHTDAPVQVDMAVARLAAPPPGEAVRSGPVPSPPPAELVMLEVRDDGPGVSAEHAARVFERLYRADPSRHRGHGGGSGLGLSIAASIVQAHGGWIELSTRPGETVFRVLLPAVPLEQRFLSKL